MKYKCPLCGSPLSEAHFNKVIKLQKKEQKVQTSELNKLKKQIQIAAANKKASDAKLKIFRKNAKIKIEDAKKEATALERSKSAVRDKRLMARIKKLEEEKKMLKKHTSPQEIGLADEVVLVRKLKTKFPGDEIIHTGKGGDILHNVMFKKEKAGSIVYECKHTDKITPNHVTQTASAKKSRNADYGILVTTGTRRNFSGLDQDTGIFIIAQSAVLILAEMLRDILITMAKQRLNAEIKSKTAKLLMDYITSPACKTPLEEAISNTEKARKNLLKEIKQHFNDWKERNELYSTLNYDVTHIQVNIARVLEGIKPFKLEKPRLEPLALPIKLKE